VICGHIREERAYWRARCSYSYGCLVVFAIVYKVDTSQCLVGTQHDRSSNFVVGCPASSLFVFHVAKLYGGCWFYGLVGFMARWLSGMSMLVALTRSNTGHTLG